MEKLNTKKWMEQIMIFLLVGGITLIGNNIAYKVPIKVGVIGMLLLIAFTLGGMLLGEIIPLKLPVVFWISIIALLATSPLTPYGAILDKQYLSKINMLAIATPILAYAGLSLGKDLKLFKTLSWKIVVVALTVYTGTFVFATTIAEIVLKITGQI